MLYLFYNAYTLLPVLLFIKSNLRVIIIRADKGRQGTIEEQAAKVRAERYVLYLLIIEKGM